MNNHHWIIESIYSHLNDPIYYYYCEKCSEEVYNKKPEIGGCLYSDGDYKTKHIHHKLDHFYKRINYYRIKAKELENIITPNKGLKARPASTSQILR